MADRLARHGLDHPEKCPLCDQMEETMNHLLVSCVFSRQFWFNLLRQVQLQDLTPQPDNNSFMEWWGNLNNQVTGPTKKGLNSIIILCAWTIWKHRNRCIFNGVTPNLTACLTKAEERKMWELAGAKGISFLLAQLPAT
jgi:hypothetical protein